MKKLLVLTTALWPLFAADLPQACASSAASAAVGTEAHTPELLIMYAIDALESENYQNARELISQILCHFPQDALTVQFIEHIQRLEPKINERLPGHSPAAVAAEPSLEIERKILM
ncbi:MAG: hypothetical protein Q8K36_05550, partial [Alphaproteobacteria bacterium]|nr:hypothetical protein [Alphaproteobacteria bacterium]